MFTLISCVASPLIAALSFAIALIARRFAKSRGRVEVATAVGFCAVAVAISPAAYAFAAADDLYRSVVERGADLSEETVELMTREREAVYTEVAFRSLFGVRGSAASSWESAPCYTASRICRAVADMDVHRPSEIWAPGFEKDLWLASLLTTLDAVLVFLATMGMRRWWLNLRKRETSNSVLLRHTAG